MSPQTIEKGKALQCVVCSATKPTGILWCLIPASPTGTQCIPTCSQEHMLDVLANIQADQFIDWQKLGCMYPRLKGQLKKIMLDKED
jgi:hypothetical protein